ncbi:MAG: tetratricopeptide repeat protein [Candidatus Riflebacteria bacterium]|nr:tetratricopeptide repeat protein [Candidatus Riflebacteria bacterium]
MKNIKSVLYIVILLMLSQSAILFGQTAKLHVDVGLNHFYKNRYLEAYKEFKQALEIDPTCAEAYYNLGRVYKAQGFTKEAMVEFQLALRIKPDYVAAKRELDALTQAYASDINSQLKSQGRDTYRQTEFSSMNPDDAESKARQMLNSGKTDEAIRYYSIVVKERPKDVSSHKMLGFLNFKTNHFTDSLDSYQKAAKLSPTDPEIPYAIGLIYMKTKSPEKAETYFKNAIKLNPSMIKAHFALGEAYEAQVKIDDAVFQFRKCLELNPGLKEAKNKLDYMVGKQSYNYYSRGSYFYQRGEYEKALPLLSMAKTHGSLTADQRRQTEEMLNASQYWVSKQQAEKKVTAEREQVMNQANITRSISPYDVSNNPNSYIGKAVEWEGDAEFINNDRGRLTICVNSNSKYDPKTNMDYCFMIVLPKKVKEDHRISDYANISVKGKIIKVEKIFYDGYGFSSKKQPVLEAVEITFKREDFDDTPLVLRF